MDVVDARGAPGFSVASDRAPTAAPPRIEGSRGGRLLNAAVEEIAEIRALTHAVVLAGFGPFPGVPFNPSAVFGR